MEGIQVSTIFTIELEVSSWLKICLFDVIAGIPESLY